MKILYFTSKEQFDNFPLSDIAEAHFVAYRERDGNYYIAKDRYGQQGSKTESSFLNQLRDNINKFQQSRKNHSVDTNNDHSVESFIQKKEAEIWQDTYNKYMGINSPHEAVAISKIFEICDMAVKEFRKSVRGE